MDIVKAFTSNDLCANITIKWNDDDPLLRASDIGKVLEIKNIRSTINDFDTDEKVVAIIDTPGGPQEVSFLTESGLYRLLGVSRKPIARQFQKWVATVIKEIRKTGKYELEEKNKLLEAEIERLSITNGTPIIYIFATDVRQTSSFLKIGITAKIKDRTKPYRQTLPYGRIVFYQTIPDTNLKTMETWINTLLKPYLVKGEMFDVDLETAKFWIMREVTSLQLSLMQDEKQKISALTHLTDYENIILKNDQPRVHTHDVGTQTEPEQLTFKVYEKENEMEKEFDKYISECCVTDIDAEVSSHDITGQYRLWSKKIGREIFSALLDYLKTNFCPIRLKIQESTSVLNGFRGVKLKSQEYKKSFAASDPETFIFEICVFTPAGKSLRSELEEEYIAWKKRVNRDLLTSDKNDLKKYLESCPYILPANVWTLGKNGPGYYGINLKKNEIYAKKVSPTAKPIEKRTTNHDIVDTYSSIVKAAESNGMSATQMSRVVEKKVIVGKHYFIKKESTPL